MMKGCNYALLIPIIGFFVEHNRAGVLALEHSIIGKEKSMSTRRRSTIDDLMDGAGERLVLRRRRPLPSLSKDKGSAP